MTPEEKQLLLKDLCARLPYGVKILDIPANVVGDLFLVSTTDTVEYETNDGTGNQTLYNIKSYLRPMSSMTEEESAILTNIANKDRGFEEDENGWIRCDSIHTKWGVWPDGCAKLLDYLNSIYVDYRGLIPMGLALEAPEGMYKTE